MVSELALLPSGRTLHRWDVAAAKSALAADALHLAHAALSRVPYCQLRHVCGRPWRDVEDGRQRPRAAAELQRLGLRPPAGWVDTDAGSEPDRG